MERKGKERTVFILFKYLLQLMLYMLYILVDGDLLNSALLIQEEATFGYGKVDLPKVNITWPWHSRWDLNSGRGIAFHIEYHYTTDPHQLKQYIFLFQILNYKVKLVQNPYDGV